MFEKCLCVVFVIYCVLLYDSCFFVFVCGIGCSTCSCVLFVNEYVFLSDAACLWSLFVCVLCGCLICV